MGDLSPHFSRSEFRCNHCGALTGPPASLLAVLERVRSITGDPLVVVSGYRCAAHNLAVGGARGSQHLRGTAADIPRGRATIAQARRAGAIGIGSKAGWAIHVDTRSGSPAEWVY